MFVAVITLIVVCSISALYLWQGNTIYTWATQTSDTTPPEEWDYKAVDGPDWYVFTGEYARE